ncbi:MAG: MarR family transcriptional regulator [Clostridiales bacterium]|nr:MarR family transcriptional regulator [Clostridiales bacterium]
MNTYHELNKFLVDVFHSILRIEAQDLKAAGYKDLSISEMHVIEAVCLLAPQNKNTAKNIADSLGITPGSLTAAINVLEKKGYLLRNTDPKDRRRIHITATEAAKQAEAAHRLIHERMIEEVAKNLDPQELQILLRALQSISKFFSQERNSNE